MIKILVDSSSDAVKEDGIYDYFMPISVNIDGIEYKDGVDINADKFYPLLMGANEFPKTSQPSPSEFVEIFEKVKKDGDELIYLALSSALSGTYQGACIAKEMVDYDGIYVVDTKTATRMIGVIAKYAKELIGKGFGAREIAARCDEFKSRVKAIAGVDTLEYLYKGGRLSRASATIGRIADIKPIISVSEEGSVEVKGKCIGKGRAIQFIVDKLSGFNIDKNFPIYSLYTFGEENSALLEEKLAEKGYKIEDRLQIGSTIGAHTGPGVYAVMFVCEK